MPTFYALLTNSNYTISDVFFHHISDYVDMMFITQWHKIFISQYGTLSDVQNINEIIRYWHYATTFLCINNNLIILLRNKSHFCYWTGKRRPLYTCMKQDPNKGLKTEGTCKCTVMRACHQCRLSTLKGHALNLTDNTIKTKEMC